MNDRSSGWLCQAHVTIVLQVYNDPGPALPKSRTGTRSAVLAWCGFPWRFLSCFRMVAAVGEQASGESSLPPCVQRQNRWQYGRRAGGGDGEVVDAGSSVAPGRSGRAASRSITRKFMNVSTALHSDVIRPFSGIPPSSYSHNPSLGHLSVCNRYLFHQTSSTSDINPSDCDTSSFSTLRRYVELFTATGR